MRQQRQPRRIRYAVAMSLDGYIAGPNGEADWITVDPDMDFSALFTQFDTILVGRATFEAMAAANRVAMPGMKTVVFSRTLHQQDYPAVQVVTENHIETLAELKAQPGKDIWLFGGGALFRSLAAAKMVDAVEVSVMPVILGTGIPLAGHITERVKLALTKHRVYASGRLSLEYAVL